ncbi:hypothetical protein BJ875DRAFT_498552 [Amylocarpus encephaloides]|uniref:WSC domain-containing protein n=1 Tax=Amylocarpus encephaloides TaxID=45428 RepID=A0A9P7YCD9_9HELO|nr:hypothetical protein BJ875DRAFT_498552 [Amylocarpus encephaloides]
MHLSKVSFVSAVSTVAAYSATQRTFAVNHFYGKGPLVEGRMDPIVNPGVTSGHVHAIQGGNNFALSMTDTQALESTCTSSLVKNDKSNYWTPSLYFKDPKTGMLESVDMFYMNVYYFFESTTDKITAFPPGLRMVIGNPNLRSPPSSGGDLNLDLGNGKPAQAIQWTCPRSNPGTPLYPVDSDGLHGVGIGDSNNKGAGTGFPDKNCDGYASPLRADVHFPSCYNPAAGLQDYKTNSAFPTNNKCPPGWIHLPHLFYEVYWDTAKFASRWTQGQGNSPWVLANGDPTGYSLHGDFLAGWDVSTLQQIIDNCDAGDSGMDKCPGLMGGLNDPSTSCNIASPIQEVISGTMSALPGNNPVGSWGTSPVVPVASSGSSTPPASASNVLSTTKNAVGGTPAATSAVDGTSVTLPTSAPVAVPTSASSPDTYSSETVTGTTTVDAAASTAAAASSPSSPSTVKEGWTYKGCFADQTQTNRVLQGITFANVGKASNTICVDYCSSRGFSLAGTEFGGQCFCGNTLKTESALPEASCSMKCEGDANQTCGGGLALSVYSSSVASKIKRSVRSRHLHMHLSS